MASRVMRVGHTLGARMLQRPRILLLKVAHGEIRGGGIASYVDRVGF